MIHRHRHSDTNGVCTCCIVPPYVLESIAKNGTQAQRALAIQTLAHDAQFRAQRAARSGARPAGRQGVGPPHKNRSIYTASNATNLPGTLVRSEGQAATADVAVDEAYDGLGATFDLYSDVYGRNSIDDNGQDLIGVVHYGNGYDNAYWDGTHMVFGDGDGTIFNRFTIAIDVMGHELTHGVTGATAGLEYHDQPGALNESISDVFGSLVKQRSLGQTAAQADWLIGAGLWAAGIKGVALRSMKAPGTAYDDPVIGKDPQPDHMSRYVHTTSDNGGVHTNSGIPNKAFYLAATAIGGNAWDVAGNIWYRTLLDSRLSATAQFQDFANLTADNADTLYGASARAAVVQAWHDVGIDVSAQGVRIHVCARGGDGAVWHRWQTAPNNGWSGWYSLGGWVDLIKVATNQDGRLEIFARGGDGAVWHNWEVSPGGGWSGWYSMGGWIDRLDVVKNADGRLEIFARGGDGALWHMWQTAPNNGWSGWYSMGGWIDMLDVARNADGRLEIFARGGDGAVWHMWQTAPNNGWSGWYSLGGWIDMLDMARNADGRLEIFARGGDGALWHMWQTAPNNGWSGWYSMGGWIDMLDLGRNADGRLEIFARGGDDAVWHMWQTAPSNGWSGWYSLGGWIDLLKVSSNDDGRMEIFVRGGDGAIYNMWQTAPSNGWSGWGSLGGWIDTLEVWPEAPGNP